ncbi:MAG: ISL3 family transposase [Bacteroidota bacterium]
MKQRRVVYVIPGKGADIIEAIATHLEEKRCERTQIKQTCIDKFHVLKLINEAMDKVRKLERKEFDMLKGYKHTFLKNDKNLSDQAKEAKFQILELMPSIANVYRHKELFAEFWTFKTKDEAGPYLSYWFDLVEKSKTFPFIQAAKTLKANWLGIVNYAETNFNNGILEGINSKIQ